MGMYQILCLIGVPSLCGSAVAVCIAHLKNISHRQKAVELGVQALLRSQLIDNYNHYKKKGFAPIYAKDNFENLYGQYEALGENGVMEKIYEEFMNLPTGDNND